VVMEEAMEEVVMEGIVEEVVKKVESKSRGEIWTIVAGSTAAGLLLITLLFRRRKARSRQVVGEDAERSIRNSITVSRIKQLSALYKKKAPSLREPTIIRLGSGGKIKGSMNDDGVSTVTGVASDHSEPQTPYTQVGDPMGPTIIDLSSNNGLNGEVLSDHSVSDASESQTPYTRATDNQGPTIIDLSNDDGSEHHGSDASESTTPYTQVTDNQGPTIIDVSNSENDEENSRQASC